MNPLKILDVTFRDGGHRNNFDFTKVQIKNILNSLETANIDYIEIGYRNGSIKKINNIGVAGLSPDSYIRFCKSHVTKAKLSIMAHCANISSKDIIALKGCGIELLRLCVPSGTHSLAYKLIEIANKEMLPVSVNFIHSSQYVVKDLCEIVDEVVEHKPTMIYFADSNGAMQTTTVSELLESCSGRHNIPFGFHAHDNIGLAQSNAVAAYKAGATYIDASLAGAGKGIGNLRLEFFIAYLHSIKQIKYNMQHLAEISNTIRDELNMATAVSSGEFIRGILDLSTKQLKEYELKASVVRS